MASWLTVDASEEEEVWQKGFTSAFGLFCEGRGA